MFIVLGLAWLYQRYDATPAVEAVLYGVSPVVISIIAFALWELSRAAVKTPILLGFGLGALALYLIDVNELLILASSALLSALFIKGLRRGNVGFFMPALPISIAAGVAPVEFGRLFALFLKFGSVVFGSGYVLLAFLRADLVTRLGWISSEQLVDAVLSGS